MAVLVMVGATLALDPVGETEADEAPPAFPVTDLDPTPNQPLFSSSVPTTVILRGSGSALAAGAVGDSTVVVTSDGAEVVVWRAIADAWTYVGSIDVEVVQSVRVIDERVLVVGSERGIPNVWEWVDGRASVLFSPPSGSIVDAWSVDGRLVVATTDHALDTADAVRFGRRDQLWYEGQDRTFESVEMENMTTVLTLFSGDGLTVVGGSDDGTPSVGYLDDRSVVADHLPTAAEFAGVTDVQLDVPNALALVSVFDVSSVIESEVRSSENGWDVVAVSPRRLEIGRIGGRIVTFDDVGVVSDLDSGSQISSAPFSDRDADVSGFVDVDGSLLIYGMTNDQPALAFWGEGARLVAIPEGAWSRYHSEVSDSYRLIHVGSREFALRGERLFVRPWNADRWHASEFEADVLFYGRPRIVETDWGFVLAPLVGSDLWRSHDGDRWERLPTSLDRTTSLVTDGVTVVAMSPESDGSGPPTTDVAVVSDSGPAKESQLGVATVQHGWSPDVGFFASVPGPDLGYVVSADGISWAHETLGARYDMVFAVQGSLYWSSGRSVNSDEPDVRFPGDATALVGLDDGVLAAVSDSGGTWIWTGTDWMTVRFGVSDGLPGRPERLTITNGAVYAFVQAGVTAEVWRLPLD